MLIKRNSSEDFRALLDWQPTEGRAGSCSFSQSGKMHSGFFCFVLFCFGSAGSSLLCGLFSVASRGYSLVAVCRLLITVASLVGERGF